MAALPHTRHTFHGDWNYTLHPVLADTSPAGDDTPSTHWDHSMLSQPALTGMPPEQLTALTEALAALHDARPGNGAGRPRRLSFADQVLATVLHLRLALPAEPLAVLFGSSRSAVHRTFHNIRKLIDEHGTTIAPAQLPPSALTALDARVLALIADSDPKIKPAC